MRTPFIALASTVAAVLTLGCTVERVSPAITVYGAIAPAPVVAGDPAMSTMAVYFTMRNRGDVADTLVGIVTDAASMAMVHTTTGSAGAMSMHPVPSLEVPAGETVRLAPGGLHVMLERLTRAIASGDSVVLDARFRHAGTIRVVAHVVPYDRLDETLTAASSDTLR